MGHGETDTLTRRRLVAGALCLALAPFLVLCHYVRINWVDVLFADEWLMQGYVYRMCDGVLTFRDLYEGFGEHNLFFPKLVITLMARLSRWNVGWEVAANVILASAAYLSLLVIMRNMAKRQGAYEAALPILILSVAVFSLNQWESWLWGLMLDNFMTMAATVCGIAALSFPGGRAWALATAIVCGVVATHSKANGLAYWPAGLLVLALDNLPKRKRTVHIVVWCAFAAASITSFLYSIMAFLRSGHSVLGGDPQVTLPKALKWLSWIHGCLGAPVLAVYAEPTYAVFAGVAGLVALTIAVASVWRLDRQAARALAPAAALAVYAVGTAILTATGRQRAEIMWCQTPRYTTHAGMLWVSLALVLGTLAALPGPEPFSRKPRNRRLVARVLLVLILVLAIERSRESAPYFSILHERLSKGRRALAAFENGPDLWPMFFNKMDELKIMRDELQRRRLSIFRDDPAPPLQEKTAGTPYDQRPAR